MIINTPTFNKVNDNYKIEFIINSTKFKNTLWYELDEIYRDFVSDSCDSALIALLIPAMDEKEDIYINGRVSETLLSNINKIQKIVQIVIPSLSIINISAKEVKDKKYNPKFVATRFSGGVDSYATLYDYFYNCTYENQKITHLTYHNVGSHGSDEVSKKLFNTRFEELKKITDKLGEKGVPFIKVDSNVDEFYIKDYLYFMQTHTLRNMSVALLLQKCLKNYYFSSTFFYSDIKVSQYYDISRVDPIILPLIRTKSIQLNAVGSEYTRVEKTIHISALSDACESLDVCVKGDDNSNCSKCFKCMRTQFTLELAGELEKFDKVFNLEVYKKEKTKYIKNLLKDDYPFNQEIVIFAKSKNYKFPFLYEKYGKFIVVLKKLKRLVKEFK